MSLPENDTAHLDQALGKGAIVLVPNYRTSDQLIDSICALRTRKGACTVQNRPAVFAVDLWLNDLWEALCLNCTHPVLGWRLLTTAEENLLWRQLIRESPEDLLLLQEEGTAVALGKALLLLQQWQIPLQNLQGWVKTGVIDRSCDDQQLALHWFKQFARHCETRQLLTFSAMVQSIVDILASDASLERLLPHELILWEFDQPPPLYTALFECLHQSGCRIQMHTSTPAAPALSLQQFASAGEECQAAAQWASTTLKAQPQARIAIICPDNTLLKFALPRAVHYQFAASRQLIGNSAVTNLMELSWFAMALGVLQLFDSELPTLELCALLRSPWLAGAQEELDARAALERRLRSRQELSVLTVNLKTLCAQQDAAWYCPILVSLFDMSIPLKPGFNQRQTPGQWLAVYQQLWNLWLPRTTLLASGDKQLIQAVDTLVIALQTMAPMGEQLQWHTAIAQLRALIRATTLQESKRQAPVMLLSPVAAAGMHFTHTWSMGMTDQHWPAIESPNAFLPLALQREQHMPGVDATATLNNAARQLQCMIGHCSQSMVLSFASHNADEPLRISPLLPAGLSPVSNQSSPWSCLPRHHHVVEPLTLEITRDTRQLPVAAPRGSSRYIELQATCPFRAFAEEGLHIRALDEPVYGLSRSAVGTLIHDVLRNLWSELGTLAALKTIGDEQLQYLIGTTVQQGLEKIRRRYPVTLTPGLQKLEQERLTALLQLWLAQEKLRDDFVIYGTELKAGWQFDSLSLDLRIDRVDRENGNLLVIDYKSGGIGTNTWGTTTPRQFQLLLYMFALEQQLETAGQPETIGGLLFASLDPAVMQYSGITDTTGIGASLDMNLENPKLRVPEAHWSSLKLRWQEELGSLAREIISGYVAVQPRQKSASCQYCALPALCRKNELGIDT